MKINWETGSWRCEEAIEPDCTIIVAGDWYPKNEQIDLAADDPEMLYGDLLPELRAADLRLVNLEASLADCGTPIAKDGPNMQVRSCALPGLTAVPFDVACLANNHVMDYGPDALASTLSALAAAGMKTVGAGMSPDAAHESLVCKVGSTRIGIVNFCEGEDGTAATHGPGTFGWEPDRVIRAVAELRATVDVVLVIAHAGREHVPVPPPYVVRLFRSIAEAGADIVIGHHPHVPQGVEIHQHVPIIYSLGNFVFLQEKGSVFRRRGLLATVEVAAKRVSGFRLTPYEINANGVRRMSRSATSWLFNELNRASASLAAAAKVREAWLAFIDSFGEDFWQEQVDGRVIAQSILEAAAARVRGKANVDYEKQAAKLRNRFITPAHQHWLADGLARFGSREIGTSERWARDLVHRWLNLEVPDRC